MIAGCMKLDFSSFPLDVFYHFKYPELLKISELLPNSDKDKSVAERVIKKLLSKTLNVGVYSGLASFISYLDNVYLKKGIECLIRDTISLINENQKVSIPIIRKSTAVIYVSFASVSNTAYQSTSSFLSRFIHMLPIIRIDDDNEERIMNELCSIYTLSLFLNIANQLNCNQREEINLLITLSEELIRQRQSNISFSCIKFPLLFEDCKDKMPSYAEPSYVYYLFKYNEKLKDWAITYEEDTKTYLESFIEDYCDNWAKYKIL